MSNSEYAGMTLNERLFSAGLLEHFDKALEERDRATLEDLLVRVETEPNLANALLGDSFECWFCGLGIDRTDSPALSISASSLWNGGAEAKPTQIIYAHWHCAETRMKGAKMTLDRDIFLPDEGDS